MMREKDGGTKKIEKKNYINVMKIVRGWCWFQKSLEAILRFKHNIRKGESEENNK